MSSDTRPLTRLVWDLPLRVFHWLLVLSLAASWATAEAGFDWRPTHMRLGYFTIGLVTFRMIWGFVGPRHARFSNFLASPLRVFHYARGMAAGKMIAQSVGHNPLGAWMVVLMLALIAVQAATGLFTSDDIVYSGPYNGTVSDSLAKTIGHLHHINFNLILAAASLHLIAIVTYTFYKKHRLVPAMFSGRKAAEMVPEQEAIAESELIKACVVILLSAALVYLLLHAAPVASTAGNIN